MSTKKSFKSKTCPSARLVLAHRAEKLTGLIGVEKALKVTDHIASCSDCQLEVSVEIKNFDRERCNEDFKNWTSAPAAERADK